MSTDARSTQRLRARIARLVQANPTWRPEQIAAEVPCARSTVYKFLRTPGPDRRTRGLHRRGARARSPVLAAVRRLVAADPYLTAAAVHQALASRAELDPAFGPVPAERTVRRLVASLRDPVDGFSVLARPAEPESSDGTPEAPDVVAAVEALRDMLREALDEIERHEVGSAARFRLRQQVVAVATALARADHLRPAGSGATSELLALLDTTCEDILVEGERRAARPRPAAPPEGAADTSPTPGPRLDGQAAALAGSAE